MVGKTVTATVGRHSGNVQARVVAGEQGGGTPTILGNWDSTICIHQQQSHKKSKTTFEENKAEQMRDV